MLTHPIAVAADVHDVAVMEHPIDEGGCHDFVTEDVAPLLEALVRCQHCGGALVAAAHQLEEQHGPGAG